MHRYWEYTIASQQMFLSLSLPLCFSHERKPTEMGKMGICSGIGNSIIEAGSPREWGGSSGTWKRSDVNTLIPPQNCQLITLPGYLAGTIAESVVWAMAKLYMASRCFCRPKQCFSQSWITKLKKTIFHVKCRSLILLWYFFKKTKPLFVESTCSHVFWFYHQKHSCGQRRAWGWGVGGPMDRAVWALALKLNLQYASLALTCTELGQIT